MTKLSIEQMLYLLYTVAYSDEGTVTQGTVKERLSKELKKNADDIYNTLYQQNLLQSPKRRRISVTEDGRKALVTNLQTTDYVFDSSKGQKVLNTLLHCLKLASLKDYVSSVTIEDMDFDTFVEKFKELYFAERKQQELRGVVAIYSRDIGLKFRENHPISQSTLDNYFNTLKLTGKVFAVTEKEEEIIQWVE
ncbi:MAG: hypothetical protein V7K55_05045 [Nostoc sp.]|uniref:hypothetical protein n=1 Tax=Nostoc sp. TaxID=1180 RepID=UPI002FFD57AA